MTDRLCLRCDWSGETADQDCPRCGAGLFAPRRAEAGPDQPRVAAPVASEGSVERSWRSRVAVVLIVAIAIGAVAFVQRHTPRASVAAVPVSTGRHGFLITPTRADDGVRLWIWNLDTNTASPGPLLDAVPEELVYSYVVRSGWVGITTASAGGERTASILRFLGTSDRPVQVASGDLIAWLPGNATVSTVRFEHVGGCRRRVSVGSWFVTTRQFVTRFEGVLCGEPTAFARDRDTPYLTIERDGRPITMRVGTGDTERILPGTKLLGASIGGDLLVQRPGAGLEHYVARLHRFRPIGGRAGAFDPLRVLGWSADGREAFVLGRYGPQGIYRIPIGPGPRPRRPTLVLPTNAVDVQATPTADGDLYISTDGAISFVHGGNVEPIAAPAGAPQPLGPVLWVATLPYSPPEG